MDTMRRAPTPPGDMLLAAVLAVFCVVSLLALVFPSVLVVITSFNASDFLTFPPQGWSLRWYAAMAKNWEVRQAAWLSLRLAALVVAIDLLLGVPAAFPLSRARFRGRDFLGTFSLSPLIVPGIVIGIGLLFFYMLLGLSLSFSLLVISHVVVTLPFIVSLTSARLTTLDPTHEEAALNLGASQIQKFIHIVLPQLWPGGGARAPPPLLLSLPLIPPSLFSPPARPPPPPRALFFLLPPPTQPLVVGGVRLGVVFAVFVLLV